MVKLRCNYRINESSTGDLVWRPSDSSYKTHIFNQLEIINTETDKETLPIVTDQTIDIMHNNSTAKKIDNDLISD